MKKFNPYTPKNILVLTEFGDLDFYQAQGILVGTTVKHKTLIL